MKPGRTYRYGERSTQPEQKYCLRNQTRKGCKYDPGLPRTSCSQNSTSQMNSQKVKTMVDQGTHQSLRRTEECKGSPQWGDERIPLSLTIPCRTSSPEMKAHNQTSTENEMRILSKDHNRG